MSREKQLDEDKSVAVTDISANKPVSRRGNFMRGYGESDPDETREKLKQLIKLGMMPRVDSTKPEEVQDRIVAYFQRCIDDGVLATISGLALALGLGRAQLGKIHRREVRKPLETYELVDMAYNIINAQYEEVMQEGKINALAGIFLMRNNLGYTNTDDTSVVSDAAPERSPEEIMQKYNKLLKD